MFSSRRRRRDDERETHATRPDAGAVASGVAVSASADATTTGRDYEALLAGWSNPIQVTLVGKPGCHLCDEARAVIEHVVRPMGAPFEEVDITVFPELREKYWDQIPVTLVGGRPVDFYTVDPKRLRDALITGMRSPSGIQRH